tara:strand:+ start:33 stop:299 length:267 start_codon:yes stop_codon:yes gene_type:complete
MSKETFFQSQGNIQVLETQIEAHHNDIKDLQQAFRTVEAMMREKFDHLKNQMHSNHIQQERRQNATQKYLIGALIGLVVNISIYYFKI